MLAVDVNICVYAFRRDSVEHDQHHNWLQSAVGGPEVVGVPALVLSSFLRLVTNHRIYREPSRPEAALEFCAALLAQPSVTLLHPGPRHWPVFVDLVGGLGLRGNDVPDAYLAAMALEAGATWVTTDRGFRRFPGLRVLLHLEGWAAAE